ELGRAAAETGDRAAASAALRDARAAAERAMGERADLEAPLVPICDACASIGDAEALAATAQLAGRLHPEARALVLFAVAAAWLRLNQPEAARTAMDAAIRLALTVEAPITLDSPEYIAWRARDTMTALAAPSDPATTRWIEEILAVSRQRGRERVLATIEACAPVFARLGVIGEVWDRLQRVEAVVSPKPV